MLSGGDTWFNGEDGERGDLYMNTSWSGKNWQPLMLLTLPHGKASLLDSDDKI